MHRYGGDDGDDGDDEDSSDATQDDDMERKGAKPGSSMPNDKASFFEKKNETTHPTYVRRIVSGRTKRFALILPINPLSRKHVCRRQIHLLSLQ